MPLSIIALIIVSLGLCILGLASLKTAGYPVGMFIVMLGAVSGFIAGRELVNYRKVSANELTAKTAPEAATPEHRVTVIESLTPHDVYEVLGFIAAGESRWIAVLRETDGDIIVYLMAEPLRGRYFKYAERETKPVYEPFPPPETRFESTAVIVPRLAPLEKDAGAGTGNPSTGSPAEKEKK